MRRKYSLDENRIMLELYYKDYGYDYIADKFKITHDQAKQHIFYLRHTDWKNRKYREWSEEEINLLYELVGRYKIKTIAKYINRSESTIYDKMQRLGISNTVSHCSGITLNQLAKIIKKDNKVIKKWIDKGLLKAVKKAVLFKAAFYFIKIENFWIFAKDNKELLNFRKIERNILLPEPLWLDEAIKNEEKSIMYKNLWTNDDDLELQRLFNLNLSYNDIAKIMNRTYSSITHRANRLCLNKHYSIKWTKEEIEKLIEMTNNNISDDDISKALNRTIYAIRYMRKSIKENKVNIIKDKKWYKLENDNINFDFFDKLEIIK